MSEHEKMLLADAIEVAIEANRQLEVMKRLNLLMFLLCILEFITAFIMCR